MNLFELYAKIALDTTEYDKSVDGAKGKAQGFAENIKGGLSTAAKVGAAALATVGAAAAAAAGKLMKAAVDSYADYEQLTGGVETLFKTSSELVMNYADNAYKTAGLSANQYMATVTSFSASLLQGLGGDTAAAANIADTAITDMADNANKMGTSMELIQNAYQGFAKQNYTMLDNLKLGYGGTATEMARLINDSGVLGDTVTVTAETVNSVSFDKMIEAIHVVQERMGITGTTAKEAASTIQGSVASMKAAWSNFLTGMADPTQDFDALIGNVIDSVITVADNIVPRIQMLLPRLVEGVSSLVQGLLPQVPKLLNTLLPALIDGATSLVNGFMTVLPSIISSLGSAVPKLVEAAISIAKNVVTGLITNLPQILASLGQALLDSVGAILRGLASIGSGAAEAAEGLRETLAGITTLKDAMNEATPLLADYDKLMNASGETLSSLNSDISAAENAITETLRSALAQQGALRDEDIADINQYIQDIQEAEQRKLEIYRNQQIAELRKLQLEQNTLDQEGAAQRLVNMQAALDESNAATEAAYTNQLGIIEQTYAARGQLGSEAYIAEQEAAKAHYEQSLAENQSYYTQGTEIIAAAAQEWVGADAEKWARLSEAMSAFNTQSEDGFNNFLINAADWGGGFEAVKAEYLNILSGLVDENSIAFLQMVADIASSGGEITAEQKEIVANMLGAFDNLPAGMDSAGKEALLGLIGGMEPLIGNVGDLSGKSADEIVDTIKEKLGIASPSTVLMEIGDNAMEGLKKGIDAKKASAGEQMTQVGKYIIDGLNKGMREREPSALGTIGGIIAAVIAKARKEGGVESPSTKFIAIGAYMMEGLEIGLKDGSDKVMETIEDITKEINSRFKELVDYKSSAQDIAGLKFDLWERTAGQGASESEKLAEKLSMLEEQQREQLNIIEAATYALNSMNEKFGANSSEALDAEKELLQAQLDLQDLYDAASEVQQQITEVNAADAVASKITNLLEDRAAAMEDQTEEAARYSSMMEKLLTQQNEQRPKLDAAIDSYASMVDLYGENSAKSEEYRNKLMDEIKTYQELETQINAVVAAQEGLNVSDVSFASSGLGRATEATVNAVAGSVSSGDGSLAISIVMPDGTKLADYLLPSLIGVAKANGTPIVNPR